MKIKKDNLIVFIFILISSLFISIPLIKLNIQYDDGIQHVIRLIETMREIKSGNILAEVMQNLCNGFGYSWNLFYSPLTAFAPLIFRIFGFSYGTCLKLFMFFISIFSGYSMYFFMKKILKNKSIDEGRKNAISILAASLYIMAPYRLTDMYMRIAVAELTSFVFIPIIFNGLYTIINQKQKSLILAFGVSGLILSHTLIAFYTAIFCVIYLLVNIKEIKKTELIELIKNIAISLLATSFYWVPLIESRFATNYEVFNQAHMVREDALSILKVEPIELFIIKDNRLAYFLGIPVIVGLIFTILMIKNKKISDRKNYYLFLILGIICATLTLDFIPFEKFPGFMKMMQFSFRLLEFSTFFITVIVSLNYGLAFNKFSLFPLIVILCVMADLLIPITRNINFNEEYYNEQALIQGIPVTEGTGRVHAGCASFEYLPSKAFNNRSYIESRGDIAIVLDGDVEISDFEKNGLTCTFKAKGNGTIELPYIYYIGYSAKVDNENFDVTESENGFCQIKLNNEHLQEIKFNYRGTIAMKTSLFVSILTVTLLIVIIIIGRYETIK